MNLPSPPPQDDDPIITQFKPVQGLRRLNDHNIKHIDRDTGQTILHNYCRYINSTPLEVYQYLIETKGCDVNVQDKNQSTSLIYALRYFKGDNIPVLTYLLSRKDVNVNIKNYNGDTLLHAASFNINSIPLEIFQLLIETLGFDVDAQNNLKMTSLHHAINSFNPNDGGDINTLKYLLTQRNINVNIKGNYGYTLLHGACEKINKLPLDIFKVLIETHGADVNEQNTNNDTPLHLALRNFNLNQGGNITTLTYLLTHKTVNVHITNNYGHTILHAACQRINDLPLDVFKLLIETIGGDVNAQDNSNDTPIHRALRYFDLNYGGNITVLTYLINQKNIDANIKSDCRHTLLHIACLNINKLPLEIFNVLIGTLGSNVNVQDEDKDTPIHLALRLFDPRQCDVAVLAYLINHNTGKVNIRGRQGHSSLHLVCISQLSGSIHSPKQNAEFDTILCQIVEIIAERCIGEVLNEVTL
jgi:ankyrin repeat protein